MKFEVVENLAEAGGDWIVRRDGVELARHCDQELALADVAARLRSAGDGTELSYSLAVRYQARG